jgi:hypothetical protein
MPTDEEIMAARSAAGGWTRETLASWGVPWPPPAGWKAAITTEPSAPRRPDTHGADGRPWIRSPHGMALRAKCPACLADMGMPCDPADPDHVHVVRVSQRAKNGPRRRRPPDDGMPTQG